MPVTIPPAAAPGLHGTHHLQIRLTIEPRRTTIQSLLLVPSPLIMLPGIRGPWFTQVRFGADLALIDTFDDPFITRGEGRPDDPRHIFSLERQGSLVVRVPLSPELSIAVLRASLFDASKARRALDYDAMDGPEVAKHKGVVRRAVIDAEALRKHRDWPTIAPLLGKPSEPEAGHFETYLDRRGRHRWRLLRPNGEIVADSGQGYASRAACEEDLRWIKRYAPDAEVWSAAPASQEPK